MFAPNDAGQTPEPFNPLPSESLVGPVRHLAHGSPEGCRRFRLSGELIQRLGPGVNLVGVAENSMPPKGSNLINDFTRARSIVGEIAPVQDKIGRCLLQITQYRLERSSIAV